MKLIQGIEKPKGLFLAAIVMIATGNGVNVFRLLKEAR